MKTRLLLVVAALASLTLVADAQTPAKTMPKKPAMGKKMPMKGKKMGKKKTMPMRDPKTGKFMKKPTTPPMKKGG